MEKKLKKVIFTFVDDSERILEGEELTVWKAICAMHSDYLLPGAPDHVLAKLYGGIVQGFVPASAITG